MQPIVVDALLVSGQPGHVRLIVGEHLLELPVEDVLEIEERPVPEGLIAGSALSARVTLQSSARLVRFCSSEAYEPLLWTARVPFTFATRKDCVYPVEPSATQAEQDFFAARGLQLGGRK